MRTRIWAAAAAAAGCTGAAMGQATVNPEQGRTPTVLRAPLDVKPGWWNQTVFYQVFIRSFQDSADGPLAGDGQGDIAGLISRLDYLNDGDPATTSDLGVTGIWLLPVTESPSYHGYDTTDYRKIEPDYGTEADFRRLLEECRRRGIRVVIDFVINHHSDKHEWFTRAAAPGSAFSDWYIWSEQDPGYRGPWNQRVWHRNGERYYYGLFSSQMPDLNFRNPEVTKAVFDVTDYWLTDMNVDGLRLDAIRHLIEDGQVQENTPQTSEWLRGFFQHYKKVKPEAMAVGEVWAGSEATSQYVGDQMDLVFEFDLANATLRAAESGKPEIVRGVMDKVLRLYPKDQYATFLANHDMPRALNHLKGDRGKARAAAAVQMTLPGVPFIYYGEELGMSGDKPDPDIRTPMQWTGGAHAGFTAGRPWRPANADSATINVEALGADPASLLNLYRRLIRLRHTEAALREGDLTWLEAKPGVLAFTRRAGEEAVAVVINLSAADVVDPARVAAGSRKAAELLGGGRVLLDKGLVWGTLRAHEAWVVRLEPGER